MRNSQHIPNNDKSPITVDVHTEKSSRKWIKQVRMNGIDITIRPIQHRDVRLEEEFIDHLSKEARRNRFLGGVSVLTPDELVALCNVDYHDSMAFIAITQDDEKSREIGVARYCKDDDDHVHEMAIVVADEFRGSNLSATLMESLINYAVAHGVTIIKSVDRYNNQDMKELAKTLGMTPTRDLDDPHQVIYTLSLASIDKENR